VSGSAESVPVQASPRDRVGWMVAAGRRSDLLAACVEVLDSGEPPEDAEVALVLGGRHAGHELARTVPPRVDQDYWWPTWALRVLLYTWPDEPEADEPEPGAGPASVALHESSAVTALDHDHWRVREMAATIVADRTLGAGADACARLATDETDRVRIAAVRALGEVGEHEHVAVVTQARDDPSDPVRRRAGRALHRLAERLDLDSPDLGPAGTS